MRGVEPQRSLRVLLADVPEPDAAAISHALEAAGWSVHGRRTTGSDGLEAALLDRGWDAVLFGGEAERSGDEASGRGSGMLAASKVRRVYPRAARYEPPARR